LAFKYCGASFDTLIDDWRMDSGMIYMSGSGGGSELKNTLKLGWQLAKQVSKNPSKPFKPFSHDCIKCKFCNIIQ